MRDWWLSPASQLAIGVVGAIAGLAFFAHVGGVF